MAIGIHCLYCTDFILYSFEVQHDDGIGGVHILTLEKVIKTYQNFAVVITIQKDSPNDKERIIDTITRQSMDTPPQS